MIVNLTYFVQIINFLVGYWVLKNFLFKPMLVKIANENFDNLQASEKIKILDSLVLINKNKMTENWHNFYKTKQSINFCKLKPVLSNKVFQPIESKNNYLTKDHIVKILLGELDDK
jgi:hypothetical protein